jgi:O-antigen/teichoic acid export membrane protein
VTDPKEKNLPSVPDAKEDLSGQRRLGRNVAFAWGGYVVNIIAGFIMPRLISDRLGQTTLGVWDFAWSVVSYFGLVQLGLSGSVQRYVARYRAKGDSAGLSRSVSTIGLSLKLSAILAAALTIITSLWIVPLFRAKLGAEVDPARLVVLFLGLEIAGSLLLTVYGGIMVGCHRWDIHNSISAISNAVMAAGMIVTVLTGGGLATLALVHCGSMTSADMVRWRLARRVCPEFVMDFRLARWETWLEQARYSAKSLIPRIADLISNQSLALLITMFLGPAMLAIYSRPRNLMRQGQTICAKFGSILIPTASSLQAQADKGSLQATFLRSTSFISVLTMPGVAILVVFGNDVIRLWMGSAYVLSGLVMILAIGCFPSLVQEPVWSILSGMNQHGRVALWKLAAAVCSAVLLWLGLAVWHWGLVQAALAFAVPQALADGLVAPVLACRALNIAPGRYYRETYFKPLGGALACVLCLALARYTFPTMWVASIVLAVAAATLLIAIYVAAFLRLKGGASCPLWTSLIPRKMKGLLRLWKNLIREQ